MLRALVAIALALAGVPAAAQMQPGEWEFTSTSTSRLLAAPQVARFRRCISKADAENPDRWMSDPGQGDCRLKPGRRTAGSYAWEMDCPKTRLRGGGSARMAGESFEGEALMAGETQGQKFEVRTKVSGRRTGACRN